MWNRACSPSEHPGTGWIGCYSMIMLAFQCKCKAKCNPTQSKPRVHEWSFTNYKQLECDKTQEKNTFYLKYRRAWVHFPPLRYHTPTAYQLIGFSGSLSTISCAKIKSLEWRWERWYMHAICKGMVWSWMETRPRFLSMTSNSKGQPDD